MRIVHDKVSGALYIKIREGKPDHAEDFSERADVYVDVDAEGNVLGLEALSFEDLAQAIDERGGNLEVPERLGRVAEVGRDLDRPIPDYDELTVGEVSEMLDGLTEAEIRKVREYEEQNKSRDTLIERLDRRLGGTA